MLVAEYDNTDVSLELFLCLVFGPWRVDVRLFDVVLRRTFVFALATFVPPLTAPGCHLMDPLSSVAAGGGASPLPGHSTST